MANINTSTLIIDEVFATKSGCKMARIHHDIGDCVYIPDTNFRVPFAPSTFDKNPNATRLNLQLSMDSAAVAYQLQEFDKWAIRYLTEHSHRIFKKTMTNEQVLAGYTSCVKTSTRDGFAPLLKVKMDTDGSNAVSCWDVMGRDIPIPKSEDWKGSHIKAKLHFSHMWIMGGQFGVVIRLTDAKIMPDVDEMTSAPHVNPFR